MLEACDLSIGYGTTEIGAGLSLGVKTGDILCLLGPNGCGKTTLFRTLHGLLPALSGEVLLGDRPITKQSRAEIARQIAYVPQAHAPPFPAEALEVGLMGRTARLGTFGQPGQYDRETALNAMRQLEIADLAQRDYSRFPGGKRQMVLIARALAQEAPLIAMDEPIACLDFGNQAQVPAQIKALAQEGTDAGHGVILSTHDPEKAFALDARVLLTKDSRIHAEGPASEVLSGTNLSHVYGIAIIIETTGSSRKVCRLSLGSQSPPTMTSDAFTMA